MRSASEQLETIQRQYTTDLKTIQQMAVLYSLWTTSVRITAD